MDIVSASYGAMIKFVTVSMPQLLKLCAQSLERKARLIPAQHTGFAELTASQWLDLCPVLAALCFMVLTPLVLCTQGTALAVGSLQLTVVGLQQAQLKHLAGNNRTG